MSTFTLATPDSTQPIPETFVPENLYSFERDLAVVRDEATNVTQLRGDGLVKPYQIKLRGTVHKESMTDLSAFLRERISYMDNVSELQYNSKQRISLLKAWIEVRTNPAYPSSADITYVLVPVYPDVPLWLIGEYYWGETTLLMGNTTILMGEQ